MLSKLTKPGPFLKASMVISWVIATMFLFGLPEWSRLANDNLAYGQVLCHEPAEQVVCGNTKESYIDIAKRLGRKRGEEYWGCSCGEGIFGDWACIVQADPDVMAKTQVETFTSYKFSVSYFITTPSATGMFAAVTFFPILFIWMYGAGNSKLHGDSRRLRFVFVTQIVFQIFFGAFLVLNVCTFPFVHTFVVGIFITSELLHFFAVAYNMGGCSSKKGITIMTMCSAGVVGITAATIIDQLAPEQGGTWLQLHAFYLGECTGLSLVMGIPVVLVCFFGNARPQGVLPMCSSGQALQKVATPDDRAQEMDITEQVPQSASLRQASEQDASV